MASFLTAIQTIVQHYNHVLDNGSGHANRMNAMGVGLESFIKDAFADSFELSEESKIKRYADFFSYLGNQNNPPDMMLRGGDAIEVKKIERLNNALALNSSYPKEKLFADSPMITDDCRHCEAWQEKDLIYAIGTVENKIRLQHLWLIYGDCFVAKAAIYERIKTTISTGIHEIADVEFSETNELGKVKKVDPLGITDLRIRGMWSIQNPTKIFANTHPITLDSSFQLSCLLTEHKFQSFSAEEQASILSMESQQFTIRNVSIQNPNNPAQLVAAKLICFKALS